KKRFITPPCSSKSGGLSQLDEIGSRVVGPRAVSKGASHSFERRRRCGSKRLVFPGEPQRTRRQAANGRGAPGQFVVVDAHRLLARAGRNLKRPFGVAARQCRRGKPVIALSCNRGRNGIGG